MVRINSAWAKEIVKDVDNLVPIDITISFNKGAQFLISSLSNKNRPFKVYNLGAGVKRITTETDICPCCKRSVDG